MRLLTAHRILIGSFVTFSVFFSLVNLRDWRAAGSIEHAVLAIAGGAMAIGFSVYLRRIWTKTTI